LKSYGREGIRGGGQKEEDLKGRNRTLLGRIEITLLKRKTEVKREQEQFERQK